MKTHSGRIIGFIFLLLSGLIHTQSRANGPRFVENLGQWDSPELFRAELNGATLFVENGAFTWLMYDEELAEYIHPTRLNSSDGIINFHAYRTSFIGANASAITGEQPNSEYRNYYLGNDESRWVHHAGVFGKIRQQGIYEGIDLVVYHKRGALKYDLKLAPFADPSQIRLSYEGVDELKLRKDDLIVRTSLGEVLEYAPFAYQLINGELIEVKCRYVLEGSELSFDLGDYDPQFPLVIDPELSFASYSGSVANNFGFTATDDEDGNLYAGSIAYSAGYPTTLGAFQQNYNGGTGNVIDCVLSKFSADGSQLLFSTYLGGSGQEMPHSIIVNSLNQLIVMGNTGSSNFPVILTSYDPTFNNGVTFNFIEVSFGNMVHGSGCDIFVSCFAEDGSALIGSTYVGGSGNDGLNVGEMLAYNYGDVFRGEVIVNENDEVIVATSSGSADFPVSGNAPQMVFHGGETDAVLFCMSPNLGDLEWSTYFGGSGDDSGYSVQLDPNGNVFLTGGTNSSNLPTNLSAWDPSLNGMVDGYVARFNPTVTDMTQCTYVGTVNYDQSYFVQIDGTGNVFVLGQTEGSMGISQGIYGNTGGKQFIKKFQNNLENTIWSTVFGNGGAEIDISPCAFLVSDCDQIYVSGWGGSTNNTHSPFIDNSTTAGLPITPDAFQSTTDGSDFYLMVLGPDAANLVYATYFGGGTSKEHVDGGTSKFDKNGSVYQAVCAGCGGFSDFPTTDGAWSELNESSCNLGVFKFDLAQINAVVDIEGPPVACEGQDIQFLNLSSGGEQFLWTFGDGSTDVSNFEPVHSFDAPGEYMVTLMVMDDNDCIQPDQTSITIEVLPGVNPQVLPFPTLCEGESLTLTGLGSENAYWSEAPGLIPGSGLTAQVNPSEPTSYYLVDFNACETDSVEAFVDFVVPAYNLEADPMICIGESLTLHADGGSSYAWEPASLLDDPSSSDPEATPVETTTFYLELITPEGCVVNDSLVVVVNMDAPGGQVYDPVQVCLGQNAALMAEDGTSWSWSPADLLSNGQVQDPIASIDSDTQFTVVITNGCGTGTSSVWVNVIVPEIAVTEDAFVCFGESVQLWASGGVDYNWSPSASLSDANLPDPVATPGQSTDYTVVVTDAFGCTLAESVNVTVWPLPGIDAGTGAVIPWYEFAELRGQANFPVLWSPNALVDCDTCLQTYAYPDSSMWFVLHTTDDNGCSNKDSVFIEVVGPLFVPNSFSPDNDGTNDIFYAYSIGLEAFELQIFNRWGELIFESDELSNGWDGTFRGKPAQVDVYVWRIRYRDPEKGDSIKSGHVTLVR